jgi:hypothetical protein
LFHGTTPFSMDIPIPSFSFATDACLTGGAAYYNNDWFYTNWCIDLPACKDEHINELELRTVLESAKRWGDQWSGKHILVRSDNMSCVSAINKSTSRSIELLGIVKELFWLSVQHNFLLSASFLP